MSAIITKIIQLPERKEGFVFIFFLSAILKTILFVFMADDPINSDGALYISAAQQFAAGNFRDGLVIYPMPLYPFTITFVHYFVSNWVTAARLISLLSMIMALIPLYLLTKDLFGRKAAFWGGIAFALNPLFHKLSILVYRGPVFLFFFALAVFFAQRAIQTRNVANFVWAAFFSWVSILFRIEGIIFIPLYLIFLIGLSLWRPYENVPYIKGIVIWCLFTVFLCLGGWFVLGHDLLSFNRIDQVLTLIKDYCNLNFLNNYFEIYSQLEDLEQMTLLPKGHQNFAEIARHCMPVIYLLGFVQTYIKVLFPVYVLPLFWGLKRSLEKSYLFILILIFLYLLMVYFFLIENDFVERRFLLAPAFLLYPWIGEGLTKILFFVHERTHKRILLVLFIMVFVLFPTYSYSRLFEKPDMTVRLAGEWLGRSGFKNARIISTDPKIPFTAGRKAYGSQSPDYVTYKNKNEDYSEIEMVALEKDMDLIIVKTKLKRRHLLPKIKNYIQIKEFIGKQKIVLIYGSKKLLESDMQQSRR